MADSSRQLGDEALPSTAPFVLSPQSVGIIALAWWGRADRGVAAGGETEGSHAGRTQRNKDITGFYNELQVFSETFARLRRSLVVSREALVW